MVCVNVAVAIAMNHKICHVKLECVCARKIYCIVCEIILKLFSNVNRALIFMHIECAKLLIMSFFLVIFIEC